MPNDRSNSVLSKILEKIELPERAYEIAEIHGNEFIATTFIDGLVQVTSLDESSMSFSILPNDVNPNREPIKLTATKANIISNSTRTELISKQWIIESTFAVWLLRHQPT